MFPMNVPSISFLVPWICLVAAIALSLLASRAGARRRKGLEAALAAKEDLQDCLSRLSTEVQILQEGGRFQSVSGALTASLGHAPEAFVAGGVEHFLALVHPEDMPRVKAPLQRGDEPLENLVFRVKDNHGAWRWLNARRQALGQAGRSLLVLREISAERSLEAALARVQKLETTSALARGTVHDLNNTLMGIQGYSEILEHAPSRGKLLGLSERARELCSRLAAQVGPGRVHIGRISLAALIRSSLSQLEAMVPDSVAFEALLEPDLPPIHGDEGLLRMALLQIMSHSVEVLAGKGGAMTLRVLSEDHSRVCIRLEDQGPGLPKAILEGLFDPPHPDTGPGSGLAAVRSIAQIHGGDFRIESQPGKGSTYTFSLPTAPEQPEPGEVEPRGAAEVCPTILVMDDDPDIRYILRQGLEGAGFRVLEGEDGVEGFGLFLRHRSTISLVLLDLTMPRMGGEEVLEGIRCLCPAMPVVLMSGYSREDAMAAFEGKGLAGFLPKPCKLRDALGVVREALGHSEGRTP
ncbi:MAG: domain S-box protein [Holophagaceae bacterium]|nr:domain S-box protein [Holophagaceae bacterium]